MIDFLPSHFFKKRKRAQVRNMLRGYRILKNSGQLGKIQEVNEDLSHTRLIHAGQYNAELIFGAGASSADLILRQYMMRRVAGLTLNGKMLAALGNSSRTIVHPLPATWRRALKKNAFDVSDFRCSILWSGFVFLSFAKGIYKWIKVFLANGVRVTKKEEKSLPPYAFFFDLQENNIPQPGKDKKSFDIFSWYLQSPVKNKAIKVLSHSIPHVKDLELNHTPITGIKNQFPPLRGFGSCVRFVFWFLKAVCLSFILFFTGKWWYALLFYEAVTAALIRFEKKADLAADYLFHNSEWLYRPLWTYDAEKKGARIILYFYSTNIESFQLPDGSVKHTGNWNIINWPYYFVWDSYQSDFIKSQVRETGVIEISGPVWFNTSNKELPQLPKKTVAVFDIAPFRSSRYSMLGLSVEYFVADTTIPFLKDIYRATRDTGCTMVIKQKRKMGITVNKEYATYIRQLALDKHVLFADPDVSAIRLIEECEIVISMPFTSTAALGKEMGKHTIYYDPRGIIQKNDPGAHGIQVISGEKELKDWLQKVAVTIPG